MYVEKCDYGNVVECRYVLVVVFDYTSAVACMGGMERHGTAIAKFRVTRSVLRVRFRAFSARPVKPGWGRESTRPDFLDFARSRLFFTRA